MKMFRRLLGAFGSVRPFIIFSTLTILCAIHTSKATILEGDDNGVGRMNVRHFSLPLGGYLRPVSGYVRPSPKFGYHPPVRYEKRYFDSLAGQSLGKRSGYPPDDSIFRPYSFQFN